jgi:hypothetical protein
MTVCPDLRPIGSAEHSFGDGNTVQAGNEALGLFLHGSMALVKSLSYGV